MTSMLTFRRLSTKKMEMEDTDENGKGGKERHLTLSNEREEDQKEEEDGGGAGAGTAAGLSTSFSTTSTSLLTTTSHENSSSSSSSRLLRAHEDLEGTMKEKDVEEENLTLLERRKERTRMQGDLRDVLDPFSTSSTLLDARPRPFPPTFPFSRPPASSLMHPSSSSSSSSWTSKDQEGPAPAPPQEQGSSFVYPSSSSFMNKEGGVPPFLPPSPPYLLSTTTRVPKEGGGEEEEGGSHPSQGSEVQGSKKKMKKGTWTPPFKPLSQGGVGVGEGGGSRGSTSPHQGSRSRLDENENEKEKVDPSTRKHGDEKERLLSTTTPLPLSSRFSSSKMSTTSSMASRFSDATLNGWMVFSLSILAYVTRFLYIGWSNKVIWDEAHFGKFASYYIKRTFYFDVHPPLGKFLIGWSGYLAGYNGTYEFESGSQYPDHLPYTHMRMFCAFWGALLVPLAFLTAKQFNMSPWACWTVASMVLFDNAYTVISRFILLDSMLLFFTGFAFFCWSKFHTYQVTAPFSMLWWKWLFTLGVALGLVSSVKWVGFFIVAVVGLYTLESLWDMLGNPLVSKTAYMYHWLSRIVGLIVTPLLIYLASFAIHFAVLNHSGPGDAQMSSLFQSNLIGTDLRNSPLEIMYGSEVTLKNTGYGGGLLHSHVQTYPHGSHQQQVTCYHHKDANNKWMIVKPRTESGNVQPLLHLKQPVLHGDTVRLLHVSTGRNLHSHALAGPVTKSMHEVSGYGNDTVGDANDHWLVEVVKDFHRAPPYTTLHTMATQFRLRHAVSGCLLRSHQVSLPKWGFNQAEVVCDQRKTSKKETDQNNVWNVEQHWNPEFPPAPFTHFQSRFLQNVMDLNVAMMASNNALTPDPDKEPDGLTSTPSQWPFLTTGLRMCSWGDTDIKFYMLGNPLVWWFSSVSLGVYVITWCGYQVRAKCHYAYPTMYPRFVYLGKYLLGAWFLHYFPFFLMGRVLYLHHYFPALYFSMFMGPFLVDTFLPPSMQMTRTRFYLRHACFLLMNLSIGVVFYMFSPLSLGLNTSSKEFARDKKWMENWNLD